MKKFIVSFLALVIFSGSALAVEYSAYEKKEFYDKYITSLVLSTQLVAMVRGVPKSKQAQLAKALEARINRTELENATWACVSKYPKSQMYEKAVLEKCCSSWNDDFRSKSIDLINKFIE